MSAERVFMMGNYEARFPVDRRYARNHMWALLCGEYWRFGFTAYAVRLLQDVYFLEWSVDEGTLLKERQPIGNIESKKAESELYAPIAGRLLRFNRSLLDDPSPINTDKYGTGWLFDMEGNPETLMTAEQYVEYLGSVWEITQRTIKGQLH
ncbi:MAG: glycine cleavage system protein H [Pirellulaceae bacterium]|nr:MAG: glycine cleavage system protein H [Pirellulaceae bacterium]